MRLSLMKIHIQLNNPRPGAIAPDGILKVSYDFGINKFIDVEIIKKLEDKHTMVLMLYFYSS